MPVMQPFLAGSNPIDAFNELDATIKNNTVTTAENMAVPTGAGIAVQVLPQSQRMIQAQAAFYLPILKSGWWLR